MNLRVYFKDGTARFVSLEELQKIDLATVKMIDAYAPRTTVRIYES